MLQTLDGTEQGRVVISIGQMGIETLPKVAHGICENRERKPVYRVLTTAPALPLGARRFKVKVQKGLKERSPTPVWFPKH